MTARLSRGPISAHTLIACGMASLALAGCTEPATAVKADDSAQVAPAPPAPPAPPAVPAAAGGAMAFDAETGLPSFTPPYPGAKVTTQIAKAYTSRASARGTAGSMIMLETPDPIEKVIAFYDDRAKAAGLRADVVVNEPDSAVRIFGSADDRRGGARGVMVAATRSDDESMTEILITSGDAQERADMEADVRRDAPRPMARLQ